MTLSHRAELRSARRLVVKVGSSSISGDRSGQLPGLVDALAHIHEAGTQVILVSSGAIATALSYLALSMRADDLATAQAAAAIGQNLLIRRYQDSLDRYGIVAGQVLLTAGDLDNPIPRNNAQRAMERLLELRTLPIVNENDTVATHEIRFGDNDRLAALVAGLLSADALILLSDVDALYTKPPSHPGASRITRVPWGDPLAGIEVSAKGTSAVGTGGAVTKVSAARHAADAGIAVLLTSTPNAAHALAGEDVGTWFEPAPLSV